MTQEIAALLMAVVLLSVIYFFRSEPTGFATVPTLDVSVAEQLGGNITAFTFQNPLDIRYRQIIVSELGNTGSIPYDAKIDVTVYSFNNTLKELATFEDDTVLLNPGMRRSFVTEFIPMETGSYYIKLRASYQYKRIITWGYFYVYLDTEQPDSNETEPEENYTIIYNYTRIPPAYLSPGVNLIPVHPNMTLIYQNSTTITAGETDIVSVRVVNIGDVSLNNIRFYISSSDSLSGDVNPKVVSSIAVNDSFPFLISVKPDINLTEGIYNLTFNVIGEETQAIGNIKIDVRKKVPQINAQELRDRISSYRYIITDLEAKIEGLYYYGVDVSDANETLSQAREAVDDAAGYLEASDYAKCKQSLDSAGQLLESAAMQIGNLTLRMYAAKPEFPYLIVLIIFLAVAVLIIYLYKRKREEKPKFLTKSESSE